MGSGNYSNVVYSANTGAAAARGENVFKYDLEVQRGNINVISPLVDPAKGNRSGVIVRESLDSPEHPTSKAVAVLFDQTGSMSTVPRLFVQKLGALMELLTSRGYLEHPHVLFGAIGDASNNERFPLQLGQFEADNRMDEALTSIILEGQGGGTQQESYELAMYFMARHTVLDCVQKRNQKGYLFILGDEMPYDRVRRSQVLRFVGVQEEADIPLETILAELREKFEVYWLMPAGTLNYNASRINDRLRELFGQNFIKLEDPRDVAEIIATLIAIGEGRDIFADLATIGSTETVARVERALRGRPVSFD